MKNHISFFSAFLMFIGMSFSFVSCNKENNSTSLIGSWRVNFDTSTEYQYEYHKGYHELTFNTDGKGSVSTSGVYYDYNDNQEHEYKDGPVHFYYIYNTEESTVTFIDINDNYAYDYIWGIWEDYFPNMSLGHKNAKAPAITCKVQIKNKVMELTSTYKGLTIPFTRQ